MEIEFFGGVEGLDPLVGIGVAHEGGPAVEGVTGDDDFFVGEEDENVAIGVGAAEPENLYGAGAAAEDEAAVEGHGGESDLHELELAEIGFGLAEIFLDGGLLVGGGRFFQGGFQIGDFLGHGDDFVFDAGYAEALNVLARGFGGDDLDARGPGAGIGFVALIVVPMKVRVDDVFYGLGREFLDLFDEGASGGRLGVSVDDEDAIAEDDDGGVAIHFVGGLGDSGVNAIGDGRDVEEVVAGYARGEAGGREEQEKR